MFKQITKENWLLFAQHHYDNPTLEKEKEFYENKLENYEDKPSRPGQFLKHQKTIANFFSISVRSGVTYFSILVFIS